MVTSQIGAVFSKLQTLSTSDHASVVSLNLFVALLCACIVIGHLLEENRWMNESITALLIVSFSLDIYWHRFQVKKKQFFRNFITIMLFGAVGTLISCAVISLGVIYFFKEMNIGSLGLGDFLAIGAIFAATDSVCTLQVLNQDETPLLYSLVFGEGVVNDATSVVLFKAIQSFDLSNINFRIALKFIGKFLYLFSASTMLGVFVGLVSAYTIKKLYFGRHSTDREFAVMMLMAYLSYILAELFYLSGILTVFFCGISMSHYTWHNVTESSRVTTKHTFATLSFVAETFIFLYVGMDALDIETWRFVNDRPGTSIAIIIWWAGLMRGAVSMALAYKQFSRSGRTTLRGNAIMITSTITVVLFSTVVFGIMTKPLIRLLLPHQKYSTTSMLSEASSLYTTSFLGSGDNSFNDSLGVRRPGSIRDLLAAPTHTIHRYWRKFDNAFMRPVFGGRGFVPFVPGSPIERSEHNLPKAAAGGSGVNNI
ncbi:hypothetical protein V6N12_058536 [Hibiscus sabdariffa]|uniref:Cation/H+ exchanger transmembrane domain-containing protein n=1 Tax=Hibiscus sabdariffa TaxID=183260 RepID=A0ABR2ESE7_9ROSI